MKTFFGNTAGRPVATDAFAYGPAAPTAEQPPLRQAAARIAVYDSLTASPRIEDVHGDTPRALIEALASRTYQLSHEAGGAIPYTVIREVVENFIHAYFSEVVVSVLDDGATIRFADQGPGITDKERAFQPGFTTATEEMKHVIKGVGSGLPVAKECLGFSGGSIVVEDNLERGTVVTLRLADQAPSSAGQLGAEDRPAVFELPALTTRQKQVLSLTMELGSVGPSAVSRELGVGLSTAYRDLAALEDSGLMTSDESGKRALTSYGVQCLDSIFKG
ncbi:MAG: hypothetical protein Kow0067_09610 [Coriobacteriia bacterium]